MAIRLGFDALPRGPHDLSREEVERSQRLRLMLAMADATAENGYAETSVADVLSRAKVSRATFYQMFSSKQDCFIATYEMAAQVMLSVFDDPELSHGTAAEQFDRIIGIYLDMLAAQPAFARLFTVEVFAAGEELLVRRDAIQRRFEALMIERIRARTEEERFACRAFVAAVGQFVTSRMAARDIDGLRALREPLVGLVRAALALREPGSV